MQKRYHDGWTIYVHIGYNGLARRLSVSLSTGCRMFWGGWVGPNARECLSATGRLSSREYFFGQRGSNGSSRNIVAGEPAPTAIDLAVPPSTRVAVQHMYNLSSMECQTCRVAMIGGEIVHSQHVVWVSILRKRRGRARGVASDRVCIYGRGR